MSAPTAVNLALVLMAVGGCAGTVPVREWPPVAAVPERVELERVPFVPQAENQCGPAALAMVLSWVGHLERLDQLVQQVYSPARRGSLPPDMTAAVRRRGLIAYPVSTLEEVVAEVAAGNPVIVLQDLGRPERPRGHYAVVVGYDLSTEQIILRSGLTPRTVYSFARFEQTWAPSGRWGLLALSPRKLPATVTEQTWLEAVVGLERAHRWQAVAAAYELGHERWPASLGMLIGLGNGRYALNDLPGAEQAFRTAIQQDPEAAAAFNNLAHVLRDSGRDDEARIAAQRAGGLAGSPWRLHGGMDLSDDWSRPRRAR